MDDLPRNAHALSSGQGYRTLLAVGEAIVAHRDLPALFHDLGGRLQEVVRFDYLVLALHDAASNTLRRDVGFLRLVAKQVAVAVENALAVECIEKLKEKLSREKAYLEEEARTEHNFEEIVGDSAALRRVLKQVETVAPTGSTVLILGETG